MSEKTPLDLVPTDELVDEIARRHDGLLVAATARLKAGESGTVVWYRGGVIAGLGLATYAKDYLLSDHTEIRRKPRGEEGEEW